MSHATAQPQLLHFDGSQLHRVAPQSLQSVQSVPAMHLGAVLQEPLDDKLNGQLLSGGVRRLAFVWLIGAPMNAYACHSINNRVWEHHSNHISQFSLICCPLQIRALLI